MSTVKVTLSMPEHAARRLLKLHEDGALPRDGVLGLITDVALEDPRDASLRRIVALQGASRAQAMMRASCSYSSPTFAVQTHGCVIDLATHEVVWPDGERWPMRPTKKEGEQA